MIFERVSCGRGGNDQKRVPDDHWNSIILRLEKILAANPDDSPVAIPVELFYSYEYGLHPNLKFEPLGGDGLLFRGRVLVPDPNASLS